MDKYGSEAVIKQLKTRRSDIDSGSQLLDRELANARQTCSRYDAVDSDLVAEYERIKEELRMRRWAQENNVPNDSIGGFSSGSELDRSGPVL